MSHLRHYNILLPKQLQPTVSSLYLPHKELLLMKTWLIWFHDNSSVASHEHLNTSFGKFPLIGFLQYLLCSALAIFRKFKISILCSSALVILRAASAQSTERAYSGPSLDLRGCLPLYLSVLMSKYVYKRWKNSYLLWAMFIICLLVSLAWVSTPWMWPWAMWRGSSLKTRISAYRISV